MLHNIERKLCTKIKHHSPNVWSFGTPLPECTNPWSGCTTYKAPMFHMPVLMHHPLCTNLRPVDILHFSTYNYLFTSSLRTVYEEQLASTVSTDTIGLTAYLLVVCLVFTSSLVSIQSLQSVWEYREDISKPSSHLPWVPQDLRTGFTCVVYEVGVRPRQEAVQFDSCNAWHQRTCKLWFVKQHFCKWYSNSKNETTRLVVHSVWCIQEIVHYVRIAFTLAKDYNCFYFLL